MTAATILDDLPDVDYHRNPALSNSGAKRLIPPSCPARYKWERDNGRPNKRAFDLGHAAHTAILGRGPEVVIVQKVTRDRQRVDAEDYTTKSAQKHRDTIYAEGKVPILAAEKARVDEMATALRKHPTASALLDPEHGRPEVSVLWHDEDRGIDRRARFDWLPDSDGGQLLVPDYKTTNSAEPRAFTRSIFTFGYDMQAVYYSDAIRAAGIAQDVEFRFIAQEITPPYLITVYELDADSLAIGRARVDQACAVYRECMRTDVWPSYSSEIELVPPPAWLANEYLEMEVV